MYIVVTGAAGFIGANLVKALNARGKTNIIAVDNLSRAGPLDKRENTRPIGRPSSPIASDNAVCNPSMPGGASSIDRSFVSGVWGAWSVAIASIVPSARPALTAATSGSVRNGGCTLNTVSYVARAASVRVK